MAETREFKLTRSGGVLGLRYTGKVLVVNGDLVIRQEMAGISIDTEQLVWKTYFTGGGKTLLTNQTYGATFYPAARVNHPETGERIWYSDLEKPIRVNESLIRYFDSEESPNPIGTVYYGSNGNIEGSGQGYRTYLEDGTSFVTYSAPA